MQFKVHKCDGSVEVYLHTKVMGSVATALCEGGGFKEGLAGDLAEAVTLFLGRRFGAELVTTDEIHSMISGVLCDTGYSSAALALRQHRINRQLMRNRTSVFYQEQFPHRILADNHTDNSWEDFPAVLWNKSIIVKDLEKNVGIDHDLARAVAGAVEEIVLRMGRYHLSSSLVKELVANELWAMRQAEKALAAQGRQGWQLPILLVGKAEMAGGERGAVAAGSNCLKVKVNATA